MRWNRTITVVDCHAEGESGQVVVGGLPPIPGGTVFEKRGMTFVLVEAAQLGFSLTPAEARELCRVGEIVKRAAAEQIAVVHPENPDIPGITNIVLTGPLHREGGDLRARNAVVVSPGRLDRSPCGTGTSARLAVLHARGLIEVGQRFVHESVIGTTFDSTVVGTTRVGGYDAVVPSVAGQAWITGLYQMGTDPTDPFPRGFTLADTWQRRIDHLPPVSSAADLD